MTQQDMTERAYALADEWIRIILATQPDVLVQQLKPTLMQGDGQDSSFNFKAVRHSAQGLAEFRQQLGNELARQYFPPPASASDD